MSSIARFDIDGWFGPVPMLTPEECARLARFFDGPLQPPALWVKGLALTNPFLRELAHHPAIVSRLVRLLGDRVVLFASDLLTRHPNQAHPWHTDADAGSAPGLCVNVWVGVRNSGAESALQLISHTHRIGKSVQQTAHEYKVKRRHRTTTRVLAWAQEAVPSAELVRPDVGDGCAVFFDGRIWHGSDNTTDRTRLAILLQYTSVDTVVQMPDFTSLNWPFTFIGPAPTLPIATA